MQPFYKRLNWWASVIWMAVTLAVLVTGWFKGDFSLIWAGPFALWLVYDLKDEWQKKEDREMELAEIIMATAKKRKESLEAEARDA